MAKKKKLSTPEWILEGYDSPAAYEKSKGVKKKEHRSVSPKNLNEGRKKKGNTFKVRRCPECNSDEVSVVVGEESKGMWECKKCKWKGKDVKKEELTEDEFMKYMDDKGEEVA
ncbi:hypothetical protein GOV13_04630 [Candidatus Pacearchaeota archaeon]|nr:hypothetical protein [Candidatus Pacearchaeota archaeon]